MHSRAGADLLAKGAACHSKLCNSIDPATVAQQNSVSDVDHALVYNQSTTVACQDQLARAQWCCDPLQFTNLDTLPRPMCSLCDAFHL